MVAEEAVGVAVVEASQLKLVRISSDGVAVKSSDGRAEVCSVVVVGEIDGTEDALVSV